MLLPGSVHPAIEFLLQLEHRSIRIRKQNDLDIVRVQVYIGSDRHLLSKLRLEQMDYALQLWEQAGEQPYQVLVEQGLDQDFLEALYSSEIILEEPIFRGTRRHQELVVGSLLHYLQPTSWSGTLSNALHFVEEEQRPVVLSLTSEGPVHAIYNTQNTYGEDEFILAPILLQVVARDDLPDYILLEVRPV